MFYSSTGGLRKDDVRCLSKLCSLLLDLSSCYASVLDVEALRLGLPVEEVISDNYFCRLTTTRIAGFA